MASAMNSQDLMLLGILVFPMTSRLEWVQNQRGLEENLLAGLLSSGHLVVAGFHNCHKI